MSDIKKDDIYVEILHSKKTMSSYGTGSLVTHLIDGVINFILFFFYEAEVGLNSWLVALGLVIYALWDAVNDPLVGFITDRPFKFTRKWGRRFPWAIGIFIPWIISFLLIFTPPDISNQWIIFAWLVSTLCVYDLLESVFTVSFEALFPDKFRSRSERLTASGFVVYIGFVGVVLGFLIPPLVIIYGNISTYALMAWACVVISIICWFLMMPGLRDDKENVERYLANYEKGQKRESYFTVLKQTLKQKTFVVFIIMIILYLALTHLMTSSLLYFTRYVLGVGTGTLLIMNILLLLGGLVAVPFWLKLNNKLGDNRKTLIIAGIVMVLSAIQFTLFTDLIILYIIIFIFGFGVGGYWVIYPVVFSQVIDESVVYYEQRREGIYNGVLNFFKNFGKALQAITLAIVHELTGFVEGASTQPPSALIGIRLHMGLIPAILMAIGLLIFWKLFDITPEKAQQYKEGIIKLKL